MPYTTIDRCDQCGKVLTEREWLGGICRECEEKAGRRLKRRRPRPEMAKSMVGKKWVLLA